MNKTDPSEEAYQRAYGAAPGMGASYENDPPPGPRGPSAPKAPVAPSHARIGVFVIYRPLLTCVFCKRRLFSGDDETAPTDPIQDNGEEYICPHTRLRELNELMARAIDGSVVINSSTPSTLMNGVTQVLVSWAEYPKRK